LYAKAEKMRSFALDTHDCLTTSLRSCSSLLLEICGELAELASRVLASLSFVYLFLLYLATRWLCLMHDPGVLWVTVVNLL